MEDFKISEYGGSEFNTTEYDILAVSENHKKETETIITCDKTIHQKAKVSLPVSVEPFVVYGKIKAKCCGNPKISIECKDNCSYVITQEICIDIPLKFGVTTEIKDEYVVCETPGFEDVCND